MEKNEERVEDNNIFVRYEYGDDLINQIRSNISSYYHYDAIKSTRALTDVLCNITDTYFYEAFGNILETSNNVINDYLYAGEQYDNRIGLYYLRNRYYNQDNGYFISADAYEPNQFSPISTHKFLYSNANPLYYFDPSGLFSVEIQASLSYLSSINNISAFPLSIAL